MVVVGIFVENPTPFLEEFWHKFVLLNYPKNKIHLYIHNAVKPQLKKTLTIIIYLCASFTQAAYHALQIDGFIEAHGKDYQSVKLIRHEENVKEWHARNQGM